MRLTSSELRSKISAPHSWEVLPASVPSIFPSMETPTPDPKPTIEISMLVEDGCPHCGAKTVQVTGGAGIVVSADEGTSFGRACLQCIADGGECCSLRSLDRRAGIGL